MIAPARKRGCTRNGSKRDRVGGAPDGKARPAVAHEGLLPFLGLRFKQLAGNFRNENGICEISVEVVGMPPPQLPADQSQNKGPEIGVAIVVKPLGLNCLGVE